MVEAMSGAQHGSLEFAPRLYTLKINGKIRDVIGEGGATIRGLCEETGLPDRHRRRRCHHHRLDRFRQGWAFAIKRINEITSEVGIGATSTKAPSPTVRLRCLVNLLPGKDGLLHISQIARQRASRTWPTLPEEGQIVGRSKVLRTGRKGPCQAVHEGT